MRNPFVTHRPLTEQDLFYGRDRAFQRLYGLLQDEQPAILLCDRPRIGKTSFLNQLESRFGSGYAVRLVSWQDTPMDEALPLSRIATMLAGTDEPSAAAGGAVRQDTGDQDEHAFLERLLDGLTSGDDRRILVAVDDVPAGVLATPAWQAALSAFQALAGGKRVSLLLTATVLRSSEATAICGERLPLVTLGNLDYDEIEQLLSIPTRGHLHYSYDGLRQIHALCGGQPYLAQLYGELIFEDRSRAGWVSLPDIQRATTLALESAQAVAFLETLWNACSVPARTVLAVHSNLVGNQGIGSPADIVRLLNRSRIRMPIQDIHDGLAELVDRGLLECLGGETHRFLSEFLHTWVRETRPIVETVAAGKRYRRAAQRRILPPAPRRIDWVAALMWMLVGFLAVLIVFVWQSREQHIFWSAEPAQGAPPPSETATAGALLPTPESGVAPGHIAYVAKDSTEDTWEIYIMRSDGSDPVRLTNNTANDSAPVISPDGRRIAFVSDRDGDREIYVMNVDGNEQLNLTNSPSEDWTPSWSPDGKAIAFASFRDDNWELYVMDADGGNQQRLTTNSAADYSPSWSPDGNQIAFVSNRDGNLEIYTVDSDGGNERRFTDDDATDQTPSWAPDGSQLVWESYRDGNMEIYAAKLDGSEPRNLSQDSMADDHGGTWSPWGGRLAFYSNRKGGWDIYAVDLETSARINLTLSDALEQAPHWGQ